MRLEDQSYGFFYAGLYTVLCIGLSICVFRQRNNVFIKCRNPYLLLLQNFGSLCCVIPLALYIAMRPNFNCVILFTGYTCNYCLFGVPVFLRCWEYCVNFHISLLKVQYRSNFFQTFAEKSWFFDHKWVVAPPFMRKALVIGMLVAAAPIVPLIISGSRFDKESYACVSKKSGTGAGAVLICLCLATGLILAKLLWRAKDIYKIKLEIALIAAIWIATEAAFTALSVPLTPTNRKFSVSNVILIADTLTLLVSNAMPLYCAHKFNKLTKGGNAGSLKHFKALLENLDFRNAFHDFLVKKFCQETLQFYEVVTHWKELPCGDPTRDARLRSIIEVFIVDNSVCQLSIDDDVRTKILEDACMDPPPFTIFDHILDIVIEEMHANSFSHYKSLLKWGSEEQVLTGGEVEPAESQA